MEILGEKNAKKLSLVRSGSTTSMSSSSSSSFKRPSREFIVECTVTHYIFDGTTVRVTFDNYFGIKGQFFESKNIIKIIKTKIYKI